ncbi:hypothetical protein [Rhizobium beringeri]|uniref:hypothetical protein n=1 Tax=Rhizobium beringeri TaxID=3019934 RepID=UPI003B5A95D5
MSSIVEEILKEHGPSRSSFITGLLKSQHGINDVNARKQLSRARGEILRFPVPLLPKREAFFYRKSQRTTEQLWTNYLDALRETGSVYGAAIDAMNRRGGLIPAAEFPVISGAPLALSKQVSTSRVAETLIAAGVLEQFNAEELGDVYKTKRPEIIGFDPDGFKSRQLAERIILDGLREWARRMGFGSYNKIVIRGEEAPRLVGQFMFDLTAPSYLSPLMNGKNNGFFAADVFAEGIFDEHAIRYFLRKSALLKATSQKSGQALTMLVAEGFTGPALTAGRAAGVILATPGTLFGSRVATALLSLTATLRNAAAIAVENPQRITRLLDDLNDIQGAAGNLHGVIFELITAYLVRNEGTSVDVGIPARDPQTGKAADIDVLLVCGKAAVTGFECKARQPGGTVSIEDVDDWLRRIPTFRAHIVKETRFREAKISFELWTTGTFEPEALLKLQREKQTRSKTPIDFKDGAAVSAIAKAAKEKSINDALNQHFLKHPLA